jgi:transcriptional regulator with XRE-family HTH domain
MAIHEEVRNAREALGITPAELARRAGVPRSLIGRFESGGNITVDTLEKLVTQLPTLDVLHFGAVNVLPAGQVPDLPTVIRDHAAAAHALIAAATRLAESSAHLLEALALSQTTAEAAEPAAEDEPELSIAR